MDYESKVISVEEALTKVKSGDVIVTGLGAAEAGAFMGNGDKLSAHASIRIV